MAGVFATDGLRGGFWALLLVALILAARGLTLLFDHSLHSIDGVLQTWFALDNFAQGNRLGTDFQSYLGITMILALLPAYLLAGETLYASTLAANLAVIVGAFGSAYCVAWLIRGIPPRSRWAVAILLVFLFYYALSVAAHGIGYPYPLSFDPGFSLRSVRGFLPVFVFPFFVFLLRAAIRNASPLPGLLLGMVAGIGLLWSNDSGIPLVLALVMALVVALHRDLGLFMKVFAAFGVGTALSSAAILMLVSHGEPGPWLQYNFRDVAGDQFWYFAAWDRSTRVFGLTDLPNILLQGNLLSSATLIVLTLSVLYAALQRLRSRGSPVRGAAFVFLGSSTIGTALIPQIGGHIDGAYSDITVFLGACAPLIVFRRPLLRWAKPIRRGISAWAPVAVGVAALIMVIFEGGKAIETATTTDHAIYEQDLGFHVTPAFHADLEAMRRLSAHWNTQSIPKDRQLLSVYTSALDIAARTKSPAPVGSLIHALGPTNRENFTALVADQEVAAVTTIAPDYSGWEGWILRANWPFFEQLHRGYTPVARNDQHVLWVRADHGSRPRASADCEVRAISNSAFEVKLKAPIAGLASVSLDRKPPFAKGRTAILTVTEDSPYTRTRQEPAWIDYPRYGVANVRDVSLVAPVEADSTTTLLLEVVDGSDIGAATCSAAIYEAVDYAALASLPEGIERHLSELAP